ncbi:MAG: phosphopantetheine-binding protein [Alphaproteobacteria bacterium]|nr:phosphopantetheine-binding protein [Alphaproteobacteria bacterium]
MTGIDSEFAGKVIEIVANAAETEADAITVNSEFENLGIESASMLCLIFDLEDMFDIQIPQDFDFTDFKTVGDMVKAIHQQVLNSEPA